MIKKIIEKLYFDRTELMFYKGLEEGTIVPFDDEFYDKMKNTYASGLPISIHIKHFKPKIGPGNCYERSLYMFFCFKDALLVRADTKNLELKYGKSDAGHGWIEIGDYVYDSTFLMRFEKDLYYDMFIPKKVKKYSHEQYRNAHSRFYDNILNTGVKDFLFGGEKRIDLITIIPFVMANAKLPGNEELLKDLNEYLELISYNEKEIYDELTNKMFEIMSEEKSLAKMC